MPRRSPTILTPDDVARFERDGFVRVPEAFPAEVALELQSEVWAELAEDHDIRRDDPTTWRTPPHSPRRAKESATNEKVGCARFEGVISDLLGYEDWERPRTWGGFLITMPSGVERWELPTEIWHWDGAPNSRGLLIFSFYADVAAGGGGTLLLAGSHRLVDGYYGSLTAEELAQPHKMHRKAFSRWDPYLAGLTGRTREPGVDRTAKYMDEATDVRGVPCRVVELTGAPGDAVFCNLGMVHCASPNTEDVPRLMRSKFLFLDESP